MSQPEPPPPSVLQPETPPRVNGGCAAVALIVIGAMILIPSGLCSAILGAGAIVELTSDPKAFMADLSDGWEIALVALAAAAIGFFLMRTGFSLNKRK